MIKTNELIERVIEIVTEEAEVTREALLSHKRTIEVVDARHIAVVELVKEGVYISRIAQTFGMTLRNVQHIITEFNTRTAHNKPLKYLHERIKRTIRNRLGASSL